jgi:predicted RNA-binding protein YlqC (UPF0109 family)
MTPTPDQFVSQLVKQIVDNKDAVSAAWVPEEGGGGVVELSLEQKDRGRVIGRQGRTIKSLRTLTKAVCAPEASFFDIDIKE